jgi:ABC-2 type transport system ATP-binding protein
VSAPDTAAIAVAGLTTGYRNGTLANDAIDLRVPQGAVLGLLGRNGAGKTTLVRQITGELQPTAGSVLVLGVDVVREHRRARALTGVARKRRSRTRTLPPPSSARCSDGCAGGPARSLAPRGRAAPGPRSPMSSS